MATHKNIPVQQERNPFLSLQRELDKAIHDFGSWLEPFSFPTERFEKLTIAPRIDIVNTDMSFKVEAEMPGLDEKDIKVSLSDGILTIKGEKSTSKKDEGKNYVMREISYGSYERSLALPESLDIDNAKASFKKGMLWIEIPKKSGAAKKSRDIEIEKIK